MSVRCPTDLLEVQESGDVTVATVVPAEFHGREADSIGKELYLLAGGAFRKELHLDLGNVRHLDGLGLARVVGLHKKVWEVGGEVRLRNVNPPVYDVFAAAKLNLLLDIARPVL